MGNVVAAIEALTEALGMKINWKILTQMGQKLLNKRRSKNKTFEDLFFMKWI